MGSEGKPGFPLEETTLLTAGDTTVLIEQTEGTLLGLVALASQVLQGLLASGHLATAHDAAMLVLNEVLLLQTTGRVLSSTVENLGLGTNSDHLGHLISDAAILNAAYPQPAKKVDDTGGRVMVAVQRIKMSVVTLSKPTIIYIRNEKGEFVCPDCGVIKARQNTMYYHMKKHTGEMSHFCGVCAKGFIQKSGLQQHMLQAHPCAAAAAGADVTGYNCPCCDHSCKMKANLIIHIARKHGETWIPHMSTVTGGICSGCDRNFSSATAYYYHAATCFIDKAPAPIAKFLDAATAKATATA